MLNRILLAGLALSGFFAPLLAQDCAFPVHPGVLEQSQPDGTRVRLRFAGNAFAHWYEDEQGYPVLATAGGYMYAQPDATGTWISTGIRVGSADPATLGAQPGQIPQAPQGLNRPPQWNAEHGHDHAPTTTGSGSGPQPQALPGALAASSTGTVKNLVICMRFSNHGPSGQNRTLPTQSDVDKIMNAVGGDPTLAPTGSVRDHYLQGSYGLLTINSTVVAWVDVPNTETYYANANSGLTSRTWELITAGLQAADPLVNFSQFDADGDGWIDAITFLHSGYGAEWGGNDQYGTNYVNRMWSHKWEIPAWTSAEGIKVSDYNISPGLWGTSGTGPGRIGVVCHELGHFFGLPDLYDTNGSGQGIGNWCLMAGGSWGFDGSQRYPSHMSAWCKAKLGWLKPERILPGTYTAAQVETSPTVYRIDTGYPVGEYLLIENRQNVGFDAQLAQSGLCVWHVDETKGSMTQNSPNTEEGFPTQAGWPTNNKHYRVALLQADGGYDMERNLDRGDNTDPYRSGGVTLIDGSTTPNLKAYQGGTIVTNGNRIDSISATGANMSFQFVNTTGPSITTTTAPIANLSTPYSLQLNSTGGTSPIVWTERAPLADYSSASQSPATFTLGGTAQNWNADEGMWAYTLPFRFPFYDQSYDRIVVSSNGFIDFQTGDAEAGNRPDWMRFFPRIAPLWDDLRTDQAGQNIFIDTSTAGQVRIRWAAAHFDSGSACNFAVRLYSDGRIRFEYGSGNTGLTPTVGISRGDSTSWNLPASLNSQSTLTNAAPMLFTRTGSQLPPGLSLSTGGLLSGTPTQTGTWTIIFRATDNLRRYAERSIVVSVGQDCNGNGISDATDIANGTSDDCDANGTPDECQPDADNDGVPNVCDGCPNDPLKTAPGVCGCGVADTDSDNDGVANCNDGCPTDPLKIAPGLCGCGVADTDSDNDGTPNCNDGCPTDPLKIAPGVCGCGVADTDSDNDGTPNCNDLCPNDPLKVAPGICGCGVADTDSDNDGTPNCNDLCPNDPLKVAPGICGCGVADTDSDNDGVANCNDGCPTDPLKIAPGLCGCGVADTDSDNDGTPNCNDLCPNDPLKVAPGICGCGVADTDSDNDGVANCNDGCPTDPLKIAPGLCGCGVADTDSDSDGTPNCNDLCPNDPLKVAPGICGCGVADTDTDNDGTADCFDGCPTDPLKIAPGLCGCGVADTDSDSDGTPNCNDLCPNDPLKVAPGICGCGVADTDTDNDGTADCFDGCPTDPLKTAPGLCGCGVADTDSDNDGTPNCNDLCPNDPLKVAPGICGCGVADTDTDNDGTADCFDGCPTDPLKTAPGLCGCGVADTDSDNDGTPNCNDLCPNDPLKVAPGICGCGVADTDTDNDGTADCFDGCPTDPLKTAPGLCGCGVADTDSDSDGTPNCNDLCPNDPLKVAPGICGCGVADTDTDNDGTADCFDGCPTDPLKTAPGLCGCGVADTDSDSDGTPNCNDLCPNDPLKVAPGICGCGVADTDSDNDGTPNCNDLCPNDPLKVAPGVCGCGVADTDSDNDGTPNCVDFCPNDPLKISPGVCGCGTPDTDTDGDTVPNCIDNCPSVANTSQADCDADQLGDACEIAAGASDCNSNTVPDACELASGSATDFNQNGVLDACEAVGLNFCFGDASGGACPCSNFGAAGRGCANSVNAQGAKLQAMGNLNPDAVVLAAQGTLPTSLCIFLQGTAAVQPVVFGDGLRCTGGALKRLSAKAAVGGLAIYPQGAELGIRARSAQLGDTIPSGALRYYQTYYRDPSGAFCAAPAGSTYNITNGVEILWP